MVNFVLASDDNYVPFLSITLFSLVENNKNDFDEMNIFILDDNISDENKKMISSLIDKNDVYLKFIETKNLDDMEFSLLKIKRNMGVSLTTYSRLFIASLLPEKIDKIIYLDCDALVVGSFKELWEMDISKYYFGAVLDVINTAVKKELGFLLTENYFNAGVLLINLKKWRESNVEESFIEFMHDNRKKFYQHDQGLLNYVFKDKIKVVNPKFNLASYFNFLDYDLAIKFSAMEGEYYSKEIIEDASENPVFLHFCGSNYGRPWFNIDHPYRELYEKYVDLVGFDKNQIFFSEKLPLKARLLYKAISNPISKYLLKFIPNSILFKSFNKNALNEFKRENEEARKLN